MKPSTTPPSTFYVTGGTLPLDAPSYVERRADDKLFQALQGGELCYVLTSRQMGKSSLMVRAADRLRRNGAAVAVLDLTALGRNLTPEQWHDGLLLRLGEQLDLEDELEAFRETHGHLAPLQRAMQALRGVVLERIRAPVVVFLDEIDVVRSLPFSSDEFFAALQALFNARAESPELRRLTFCLLGVATPSDLIRDVRTTPFNIGRRIELDDFTPAEAAPLGRGLHENEETARRLLQRVLYWSGGHPYLTQRLCRAIAADAAITCAEGVDRICEALFLSSRARETEDNLVFARNRALNPELDHVALLELYARIHEQRPIPDNPTDPLTGALRLAGLTRVRAGYLKVSNRIYRRVFDHAWIDANLPDEERESAVYYRVFTRRFGLPVGIGRLTKEQARCRAVSYKFIRQGRGRMPYKVQAVDSADRLTAKHEQATHVELAAPRLPADRKNQVLSQECQWEFITDAAGRIVYEKAHDAQNNLVWGLVYSPASPGQPAHAHYIGPDGFPRASRNTLAKFVEIDYSPHGDEIGVRYFDRQRRPQLGGNDRVYSRQRAFDQRGLVLEESALDAEGQPMPDKNGVHKRIFAYDSEGNQTEVANFDTAGQPVLSEDGVHKWTARYDERGNLIEQAYFDTAGQPVLDKDGDHKWTARYDERGNLIEVALFDTAGKPMLDKDGVHKVTARYDERGNQIEQAYFDTAGQPVLHKDGYHKATIRYDERGNLIEVTRFDTDGNPIDP
uniref:YD repeat-containing protein n=1 Tax=Candidatus Kentrum sp. LPFa TaxID=2126335 RepID=A0A450W815_9GAMM|nr:MAG: YD repeat-containing protein [Candidatus Kentron sp. LPFa]VFK29290.1 MAG: YD repeat-containing protein [Candidatus Kentron sp. LPFa]